MVWQGGASFGVVRGFTAEDICSPGQALDSFRTHGAGDAGQSSCPRTYPSLSCEKIFLTMMALSVADSAMDKINTFTLPSCAASFICSPFTCRQDASKTATGPAAPTKAFERSKSAWRNDKETVRVGLAGCAWDKPCASWDFRLPTLRLNGRGLGLSLVVQRSGKVRG